MPDIREKVEADRGLLKRIQLHIPGYAGYRRREDIRTADLLLRKQIADRLKTARSLAEQSRSSLVEKGALTHLDKVGGLLSKLQEIEGQVRHAEGGYSGISADIKILEREMDHLYEYDNSIVEALLAVEQSITTLNTTASGGGDISGSVSTVRQKLDELQLTFRRRINVITGSEVV